MIRLLLTDDARLRGQHLQREQVAEAYLPPRRDWLRVNMVTSLDGAATVAGRSRGLQVPADLEVFAALRSLADVVLVGAGTVRAEGYGGVRLSAEKQAARRSRGLAGLPALAVLTGSGSIRPQDPVVAQATSPVLVLTSAEGAHPVPGAEVIACRGSAAELDLDDAVAALRRRGYRHILCEGGPQVFASLLERHLVDELCLTISPLLAGSAPHRLTAGTGWPVPVPLRPVQVAEGDGALLVRYAVARE